MVAENLDSTVRQEMIDRIKLRDQVFSIYAGAISAIIGFGIQYPNTQKALITIPFLSFALSLLSGYHDVVIQYLHEYLAKKGIGWETSETRKRYAKDKRKYMYLAAQIFIFVGSSVAALLLNIDMLKQHNATLIITWISGAVCALATMFVVMHTRIWRHKNKK